MSRAARLVFDRAWSSTRPGRLVFGDDGGSTPEPTLDAILGGTLLLPLPVAAGRLVRPVHASGVLTLPLPVMAGDVHYDSNTERPLVLRVRSMHQPALPLQHAAGDEWTNARQLAATARDAWTPADSLRAAAAARHANAQRLLASARDGWQPAISLRTRSSTGFQQSRVVRSAAATGWQPAIALQLAQRAPHADMLLLRARARTGWQQADGRRLVVADLAGQALRLDTGWRVRWQNAMRPAPGRTVFPKPPEPRDPCYVPSGRLVFDQLRATQRHGRLVFVCERAGPGPQATLVIPFLSVYMATHTLTARLLPNNERVHLTDVTLTADADNPHWSMTATGPVHLFDQLRPNGAPRQLRINIDGLPWTFVVEGIGRTRNPDERRVQIRGRSITALLGNPYMPAQTWLNTGDMTAQQLVLAALEFTDIEVDWQISDWLVPAGSWSFNGTPMAVAKRVAEAAGAVLQTHPTAGTLQFLPRYPVLPWEWMAPSTVPDVQMPSAAIRTDSLDPREEPAWDAVYVCGTTNGILRRVRRTGYAGTLLAPQVTDALITQDAVARMRGESIIGAGGRGADVSISMQILTGGTLPGVLRVNQLLHVDEPAETWRGLVRGVTVRAGDSGVDQTVRVERHE